MPGMDGIRLLSHVAALSCHPAAILLSGEDPRVLDSSQLFAEAKGLTILGTLRKPVDSGSLTEVLRRYRPAPGRPSHCRPTINQCHTKLEVAGSFWIRNSLGVKPPRLSWGISAL
ncbi:hypothetical protein [Lysobacter antibioticus]|uniref:hypothetical protein n=1 Tax=Lysobacter antibioticus TaxID=84531 RepID=UPI003CCDE084